jgi:hypothetical protein
MKVRDWLVKRLPKTDDQDAALRVLAMIFKEMCELELAQSHSEQELVCNPKKKEERVT